MSEEQRTNCVWLLDWMGAIFFGLGLLGGITGIADLNAQAAFWGIGCVKFLSAKALRDRWLAPRREA